MEDFKIKVNNPEESELTQRLMFKLGYKWKYNHTDVHSTDQPFLFFINGYITYSWINVTFSETSLRELTFEELIDELNSFIDNKS